MTPPRKMTLQRALLIVIATVLVAVLLPAGLLVERRLAEAIEGQARQDLDLAPTVLREHRAQAMDALMMHAKEVAQTAGLAEALAAGDRERARQLVDAARGNYGEDAVLVTATGETIAGPPPPADLLDRADEMPVAVVPGEDRLHVVALAPVAADGERVGVAGVTVGFGAAEAAALAALTRTHVVILRADRTFSATSATGADSAAAVSAASRVTFDGRTEDVSTDERRLLAMAAPVGEDAIVVFVRDLDRDLAILGRLRRIAVLSVAAAAIFALALGAVFATLLTRPVRALAGAADRLAAGDFDAPLHRPVITEVRRMADAFDAMRRALAARLDELQAANRELADRQGRLVALQAELIQRDRLAHSGQLVAQLAHEIRNPVANVRNCLELIRRRVGADAESREFADLAIDELLRMHELAEQMLDLHRPRADGGEADALAVASEVAALVSIGAPDGLAIDVRGDDSCTAAIAPDALKQVLLNLVRNAREAMRDDGRITIGIRCQGASAVLEVADTGPGLAADVMPRIFDPFFTTKGAVHGVGLGLFVAEGIVRGAGGRMAAANAETGGAVFRIELPLATPPRERPLAEAHA